MTEEQAQRLAELIRLSKERPHSLIYRAGRRRWSEIQHERERLAELERHLVEDDEVPL